VLIGQAVDENKVFICLTEIFVIDLKKASFCLLAINVAIPVVRAHVGSHTSALMSTAQQRAISTSESSSISVSVFSGDAITEQAGIRRERGLLVALAITLYDKVRVK
jgi:hypothetical protein